MTDEVDDPWGAFGSDSDSEGEGPSNTADEVSQVHAPHLHDTIVAYITRRLLEGRKTTPLQHRLVAFSHCDGDQQKQLHSTISERCSTRGLQVLKAPDIANPDYGTLICDAAVLFCSIGSPLTAECTPKLDSKIKQDLVPGGFALLILTNNSTRNSADDSDCFMPKKVLESWRGTPFDAAVWDVERAELIHHYYTTGFELTAISVTKRPCTANTLSCPWKDLGRKMSSNLAEITNETWLMHERRIISSATVTRTAAEVIAGAAVPLADESVSTAVKALEKHGFVVLKDVFDPAKQTLPWGKAILSDFQAAANVLKNRDNVDILNPGQESMSDPLNYKEMAMREDLRVDLRDGPASKERRDKENKAAYKKMQIQPETDDVPTIVPSAEGMFEGSIRFHPSILRIVRKLFNPLPEDDKNCAPKLHHGNFGRWNFGGAGPDGTPLPLRVGQVGAVVSMPGSADQAIHADTPHLFEHIDCLPCHYANLFTPGASLEDKFDADGNFTGDMDAGGTAFVHGSHRLSVTASLTAEQRDSLEGTALSTTGSASKLRDDMHARIVRPSLRLGDAIIFDCRVLHFGLANRSRIDPLDSLSGRRPMLYVNLTHSWFHDPKNWDLNKKIFP